MTLVADPQSPEATPQRRVSQTRLKRPENTKRLRNRRLRVADLQLTELKAEGTFRGYGEFHASVEDLSLHGLRLAIADEQARADLFLPGDRIAALSVWGGGALVYQGAAIIRYVSDIENGRVILGVELSGQGVRIGELYRQGTRHGFLQRWEARERTSDAVAIDSEFRSYVADLTESLRVLETFLDEEEDALEGHDKLTRDKTVQEYLDIISPRVRSLMEDASRTLGERLQSQPDEESRVYESFLRKHLGPYLWQSALLKRAYEKPLGYAGDYEMMNMIYRDPAEGNRLFAKTMNLYAVHEAAAKALKNRVSLLKSEVIQAASEKRDRRVCIASIGCGPATELNQLLRERPELGEHLEVTLMDQEEQSIQYCERTLGELAIETGARVHFVRESVRRLITRGQLSHTLNRQDFIYSAGLFDYLNDQGFRKLLSVLYETAAEGGTLFIGNFAPSNPSRWLMEYLLGWFLVHRTESELYELASHLEPKPSSVQVEREPLNVNLFLRITR